MVESCKSYRELLAERQGKGFSEQRLTKVLLEVLPELEALHATGRVHGHICSDALIHNCETQQTGLKPPPAPAIGDPSDIKADLYDLGMTIITLLTGRSLDEVRGFGDVLCWQDDRLVSDNFASVINRSIETNPGLHYDSAKEMLQELEEQGSDDPFHSFKDSGSDAWLDHGSKPMQPIQPANSLPPGANAQGGSNHLADDVSVTKQGLKPEQVYVLIGASLLGASLVVIAGLLFRQSQFFTPKATGGQELSSLQGGQELSLNQAGQELSPIQGVNPTLRPQQGVTRNTSAGQVNFSGINLPITDKLCNKKGNFCIYNLANLINQESGQATYNFSEINQGQLVNINGTITIENLQKNDGRRVFTFAFRDDQSTTTSGWAAAGIFSLDQDPSKPGILTRFKTTESFGPKTPVGLENTAYVFPQ